MAIPREYATSNPLVRDALAEIPITAKYGVRVGDFVAPDYPIDAEAVDVLVESEHNLDTDDIRAADALAKEVRVGQGGSNTITVVERAQKSKIDSRKIEDAGRHGIDILAKRADIHRNDILDLKEYRIALLTTSAANFVASHKDTTGLNFRTDDLMALADTWNEKLSDDGGFEGRRGIIGKAAWRFARQNAGFREFAGGSDETAGASDLTLAAFAEYLGLDEVRLGNYKRKLGNATTATQFWPVDSFLLFAQNDSVSTNTFAVTPVVPYGEAQGSAGQVVDVRTEPLPGTERLTEVGAYHRYRNLMRNGLLGFLVTGIVGTPAP